MSKQFKNLTSEVNSMSRQSTNRDLMDISLFSECLTTVKENVNYMETCFNNLKIKNEVLKKENFNLKSNINELEEENKQLKNEKFKHKVMDSKTLASKPGSSAMDKQKECKNFSKINQEITSTTKPPFQKNTNFNKYQPKKLEQKCFKCNKNETNTENPKNKIDWTKPGPRFEEFKKKYFGDDEYKFSQNYLENE